MSTTPLKYRKSAELREIRKSGNHPELAIEIDIILEQRKLWVQQQAFDARLRERRNSVKRTAPRKSAIQRAFDENRDWGVDPDVDYFPSHNDAYVA